MRRAPQVNWKCKREDGGYVATDPDTGEKAAFPTLAEALEYTVGKMIGVRNG